MSMSSPVLATTTNSSGPTTSSIPRASFAPPVPPASTTTFPFSDTSRDGGEAGTPAFTGAAPGKGEMPWRSLPPRVREPRDPDACMGLVACVHRDHQRRERLGDTRHLQAPTVHAPQSVDPLDQLRRAALVIARVPAHEIG